MSATIDSTALFTISYGLFVLFSRDGERDGGCIVNTVSQLTDQPKRLSIGVNKQNQTCDMILNSGIFNVSVLTQSAPFSLFEHFGFQSGRAADKFAGRNDPRSANGLRYLSDHANAVLSGKVTQVVDCGTHFLFIADLTEAVNLSRDPSVTYAYYFEYIKPKPAPKQKHGFVCKICGYVYEGDTLPPDFICPLCKHGAEDFEPIGLA